MLPAWRGLPTAVHGRRRDRRGREVGPPGLSVWEFDWDGDATVVALVSEDPTGNGWYGARLARLDLDARTARRLYEPRAHRSRASRSRPTGRRAAIVEGYSSDPGLLSGSVIDRRPRGRRARRIRGPDLETVGASTWTGDDHLVVRPLRRHRARPAGAVARRPARGALGRATRSSATRPDEAVAWTAGDARAHHAPGARPAAGAGAVRSGDRRAGRGSPAFNDAIVEGSSFPDVRTLQLDRARRHGDPGPPPDPAAAPAVPCR